MPAAKPKIYGVEAKSRPGTRVFFFFGLALIMTGAVSFLFADLLWRRGWTAGASILMVLFLPLMFLNAVGATAPPFSQTTPSPASSRGHPSTAGRCVPFPNFRLLPRVPLIFPNFADDVAACLQRALNIHRAFILRLRG